MAPAGALSTANMVAADECEENLTLKNEENGNLCHISPFFRSLYEDFPDSTPFYFVYQNHPPLVVATNTELT